MPASFALTPRAQPPAVEGTPYVARFVSHRGDPKEPEISGTMMRDAEARLRIDYFDREGNTVLSMIDDVPTKTLFIQQPSGDFEAESYGLTMSCWSYRRVEPVEAGPDEMLHEVPCSRFPLKSLSPSAGADAGEVWVANKLGIVIKDVNPTEGWTWEVTEIDFREPPPGAFAPKAIS